MKTKINKNFKGIIYKYTNLINGKIYIGQTIHEMKRYKSFFRFEKYYAGRRINAARKKYNKPEYWSYEKLEIEIPKDRLSEREIYYINLFDSTNPNKGYNLTEGGETNGCVEVTEETKRKLSLAHKGKKHTKEAIEKTANFNRKYKNISILQYDKNGNFIKEWRDCYETSKYFGGNKQDHIIECCQGVRKTTLNYVWMFKNGKIKDKINVNIKPNRKNIKLSDYQIQKLIEKTRKAVYQIDSKTNEIIKKWDSISEVQKEFGKKVTHISAVCKGKRDTAYNYKWCYVDNPDLVKNYKKFANKYKPILQYDLNNNFVKEWMSIVDCANNLKIRQSDISACCRGRQLSVKGYIFKFKNNPELYGSKCNDSRKKKIEQYDLEGNYIRTWDCSKDIYKTLGILQSNISSCCRGIYKQSGGFKWKYVS